MAGIIPEGQQVCKECMEGKKPEYRPEWKECMMHAFLRNRRKQNEQRRIQRPNCRKSDT